jgi:hypothetical protein
MKSLLKIHKLNNKWLNDHYLENIKDNFLYNQVIRFFYHIFLDIIY